MKNTLRRFDYNNKVVVITGGSRGLGLVLARELAARGAHLALLARDAEELATASAELAAQFPAISIHTEVCDITNRHEVESSIPNILQRFGRIDMLINNAGIISVTPYENSTESDFRRSIESHFWGPYYMTEAVLPHFKNKGEGRVVNISSIGGKIAVPHLAPYCAGKFALAGYSQALSGELMKDKIYVTSVYPGLMRTGSVGQAEIKGQAQMEYAWFSLASSLPLLTVSAEKAARDILNAAAKGKSELIISLPAKIAAKFQSLAPELFTDITSATTDLLPSPAAHSKGPVKGKEAHSFLSPNFATRLSEQAAERNNEHGI